ncbi:MAG: hypothetical protein UT30_C0014G0021 [Candidatus Uhrbacteria bacterium GW2011_GWF2_39_13]|uniref:LamG-like jellyroll fold domain-containing protein n=1 Tax=Candidatus Uhrbacteria bacterium GW2011_GWF2_39_13 TaxID=1618995 RepID=A0A0G0MLI2_9BACT|nr:MAG: hypothetical protein UT30_C0014G0021 [Candidatus Uhrbacteria bacterium GW2011_GWF2_39_13]
MNGTSFLLQMAEVEPKITPKQQTSITRISGMKKQLAEKQDVINIAILTAVILAVGIYLICTTVLISKDGTSYIGYAKQFVGNNLVETVRSIEGCPGYPFLIYLMHKTVGLFARTDSLQRWIVSAQAVSLVSKLIASIALYFVGSYFAGRKAAFWGILILSVLPDSAEYGSDALTEWPQLMFLANGFLLLLWGTQKRASWLFGLAGIAAGLGYLVRSEGCQLLIYGGVWLVFNLIRPEGKMRRTKAVVALILLAAGFAVIAVPYMKSKGYVFPDQRILKLPAMLSVNDNTDSACGTDICVAGISLGKTMGNKTLTKNICETLMYYFVPGLLIGCWYYFGRQRKSQEQAFYAGAFIVFNIVMLLWQILHQHFLSRRHTLALVAFTVFYIPIGMEIIAGWICERASKDKPVTERDKHRWFYVLMIIGIAICLPKLFKFVGTQKYGYREAANWLVANTTQADVIAVPDKRITFYAERKGMEYENDNTTVNPVSARYIVKISKFEYHKEVKSDKNFRYDASSIVDDNESDAFLYELNKCSSLKGLVGYWAANNDNLDYSIYRNHTTAHGNISYAASEYGWAFSFNPNMKSYIDCGNNSVLNPIDSITLSALIYPVTASPGTIIAKNGPYCMQFGNDGKITAGIYAGSPASWAFAKSVSVLPLNIWHHVLMTYDGSYIKIYIDGKIDGTPLSKSGNMAITHDNVRIGYGAKGLDYYFNGLIDEVMLFNTALQLDKIKALNEMLKSKTVPTFGDDVNAYPVFDYWKIEKECSFWVDGRKKRELCIYKMK